MSVFLDTGLYYALQNEGSSRHEPARTAFDAVFRGRFGSAFTSEYVYDEAVTLVRKRTGRYDEAKTVGDRILGRDGYPDAVDFHFVSRAEFDFAVEAFDRYDDQPLSFTDATTVALVEAHDIDRVLAFDDDFDGVVDRVDPRSVAGA
ncbi:type II toxin-antitoxin system VapC family toxin [Halosimplex halobium]|uniref:type II toxin-antitoxin system VapC family toxin n=1 Tax=Halosimplex halobium TaxID=3396618 RepID=UPI003F563948